MALAPLRPPPAALILDFDGVIMDSMGLKLESYCYALDGQGFAREDVRRVQLETAGLSRQKVLPILYGRLAGKPMPADLYADALERFNRHDAESRARMRFQPGAREFLEAASRRLPLAVVTGTPQSVIDATIDYFDLRQLFRGVRGTPGDKPGHLRDLSARFGAEPAPCLYVGDAVGDQDAARAAGLPFIGVDNGDHPFRPDHLLATVGRLAELGPALGLG